MQLNFLSARPRPAPPAPKTIAPGWVEDCPLRWSRYTGTHRLSVQLDDPQSSTWRWWVQRWPQVSKLNGTAPSAEVGAIRAEAAFAELAVCP